MNRSWQQTCAWLARSLAIASLLLLLLIAFGLKAQQQQQQQQQQNLVDLNNLAAPNYPYYLQSPIQPNELQQQQQQQTRNQFELGPKLITANETTGNNQGRDVADQKLAQISRRTNIPSAQTSGQPGLVLPSGANQLATPQPISEAPQVIQAAALPQNTANQQGQQQPAPIVDYLAPVNKPAAPCLYDKSYFGKFDECLARRPYPIIGLPAFKNEDLLIKRGLSDRHGCAFILSNGLFKNHQISKYAIDSDSRCLDQGNVQLSLQFSNATLAYLWTLRCLNQADQLFDDSTFDGKTTSNKQQEESICVGSSQSFGFTSMQLNNIEAQIELATDIYKNWRLTNVTVALLNHQPPTTMSTMRSFAAVHQQTKSSSSTSSSTNDHHGNHQHQHHQQSNTIDTSGSSPVSSALKDFVFESLDGDELNWRYLHLYRNWSRNQMHTNFIDQFRRFMWISLQRCLSESSDKLPVKLVDLFGQQKYN